jgi:hypothetical protein
MLIYKGFDHGPKTQLDAAFRQSVDFGHIKDSLGAYCAQNQGTERN